MDNEPIRENQAAGATASAESTTRTEQARERVQQTADEARENLVRGYHELEERYQETRDRVYDVNRRAVTFIQDNPAMSLAAAFGVGYVLGKLASRRWLS